MTCDICPYCDGSGTRDFLSGASCYYCHGKGVIEEGDPEDEDEDEDEDARLDYEREQELRDNERTGY